MHIESSTLAGELCEKLPAKVKLKDGSGWSLYAVVGTTPTAIDPDVHVVDTLSRFEDVQKARLF
jgi:RA domain-containing protein